MKNVILLADNDPNFAKTWEASLAKAGYEVLLSTNTLATHTILKSRRVDLAILDLRLENDDDKDDLSGYEIAKAHAYRYIPKIILSGYDIKKRIASELLTAEPGELPFAVTVIDKAEADDLLLEGIHKAIDSWSSRRITTIKVSEHIHADYKTTQRQARINYIAASIVSILGFVLIFAGIYLAWSNKLTIGLVGATSGILVEILSYLFFRRLDLSNDRMDKYHQEILQTYWLELLLAVSEQLPGEKQVTITEEILSRAAANWLGGYKPEQFSKSSTVSQDKK